MEARKAAIRKLIEAEKRKKAAMAPLFKKAMNDFLDAVQADEGITLNENIAINNKHAEARREAINDLTELLLPNQESENVSKPEYLTERFNELSLQLDEENLDDYSLAKNRAKIDEIKSEIKNIEEQEIQIIESCKPKEARLDELLKKTEVFKLKDKLKEKLDLLKSKRSPSHAGFRLRIAQQEEKNKILRDKIEKIEKALAKKTKRPEIGENYTQVQKNPEDDEESRKNKTQ